MIMYCERCETKMEYQYEVEERKTIFVLWHCECGYKYLERKRLPAAAAITSPRTSR